MVTMLLGFRKVVASWLKLGNVADQREQEPAGKAQLSSTW
jgi:hypothetical protein